MAENQLGNWGWNNGPTQPTKLCQKQFAHLAIFLSRSHWMHSALIAAAFVLLWGKPVGKNVVVVVVVVFFCCYKNPTDFPRPKRKGKKGFGSFLFRHKNRSFEEWRIFRTHFFWIVFRWWIHPFLNRKVVKDDPKVRIAHGTVLKVS